MSLRGSSHPLQGIWHVGARDGYLPVSVPPALEQDIEFFMIDGDASAIGSPVQLLDGRKSNARCVRAAAVVGERIGDTAWRRNACPYSSGLIRLDERFRNWTVFGNGDIDYVLGEAHQVMETVSVPITTLDDLWERRDMFGLRGDPSILVIDAQGASGRILRGSEAKLLAQLDAIVVESELIPFYGGVPSLCEILPLLATHGFWFADFLPEESPWACPVRRPIGQRSGTLRGSVDAVFVRDPATIPEDDVNRIARYATACALLGHIDLSCDACARAKRVLPHGFARAVQSAIQASPAIYPPSFAEHSSGTMRIISESQLQFVKADSSAIENCLREWELSALANRVRAQRLSQGASIGAGRQAAEITACTDSSVGRTKSENRVRVIEDTLRMSKLVHASGVVLTHSLCEGVKLPEVAFQRVDTGNTEDEPLVRRIVRAHGAQRRESPRGDAERASGSWSESGWNGSQAELLASLDRGDLHLVGKILRTMFLQSALTGIAMGAAEYSAIHSNEDRLELYSLQWLDSFVGVCQEAGALPTSNPEVDLRGHQQALCCDLMQLVRKLQSITGIALAFPSVGAPFGCCIGSSIIPRVTLFHYLLAWHVVSRQQNSAADTIIELGGGFGGLTCLLAGRACRRYVGVDLPGACAIQAYFLGRARPDLQLQLFGEPLSQEASVRLVPSWAFASDSRAESWRGSLLINQDCLLEMSPMSAVKLIRAARALEPIGFVSVSPDRSGSSIKSTGQSIMDLVRIAGGWHRVDRAPFMPRPGYWRETYMPCGA